MIFLIVFGGLSLLLTVIWILWSAFDKAVSAQLYYNHSTFTSLVLAHCPVLQSPYVFFQQFAHYHMIDHIAYLYFCGILRVP